MAFSSNLICLFSTFSKLIVHVALRTCKDGIYNSCCDLKSEMAHSIAQFVFLFDRKSSRKLFTSHFWGFCLASACRLYLFRLVKTC